MSDRDDVVATATAIVRDPTCHPPGALAWAAGALAGEVERLKAEVAASAHLAESKQSTRLGRICEEYGLPVEAYTKLDNLVQEMCEEEYLRGREDGYHDGWDSAAFFHSSEQE